MCVTYFEIGRMIVEEEQGGKARAEYRRKLLSELSTYLTEHVGKGFSERTLEYARRFYLVYVPSVERSLSAITKKDVDRIPQTMCAKSDNSVNNQIGHPMCRQYNKDRSNRPLSIDDYPFQLSWSHYRVLMNIENEGARSFYEIESTKQQWTVRRLQRECSSSLYERLALSRDRDEVMRLSKEGHIIEKPRDIIKDPFVLEFLDLDETPRYSETDLEAAIIDRLSRFLLEMGKGFLFEARQKRFTFDEDHFIVDLVFFNRLLQCYVLIDLKTHKLNHQDLGQMQMYVNYFDRYVRMEKELPTVGILLCEKKNSRLVEMTLPEGADIYASEYKLYLPDKALLQKKLAEWAEEFEEEKGAEQLYESSD
jgi:predicted nuclease of restriction endonuclease-like (RecB) superfamily